ncbi:MAG: hypothetical protein E7231_09640 [Cellulosilyticum sp.]|nr:hypothetical protein [Cellulosilyticum sp.]
MSRSECCGFFYRMNHFIEKELKMEIRKAMGYFKQALENEQLSLHTLRAYEQDLEQFCDCIGKEDLDELGFEDFQDYLAQIASLKVTSIKRKRVVLNRFLAFCYRKRLCKERLHEYIDPIRSKKTAIPKEVLSKEEIIQIQSFLREEKEQAALKCHSPYYEYLYYCTVRNELLIAFLLYTGCRAHEAVSIQKKDIDFEKNIITLFTKGAKYNPIPIHDELIEAFSIYEKGIEKLGETLKATIEKSIYLFPSKQDGMQYMATRTLHDLMKKLSNVLNRPIHAHLFRHTFASYCIAANMDISTISSLISHSNPSITLSIYTHEIDAHNKQEQIKKLRFN